MRQSRGLSTIPPSAPQWRHASAALAGAVALLLLVSGLLLAPPHGAWTGPSGLVGLAPASAGDCVPHDAARPSGDRRSACLASALCCLAGCDGSAAPLGAPAGREAFVLPLTREGNAGRGYACVDDCLALAGWASAWSSRAPPLHA